MKYMSFQIVLNVLKIKKFWKLIDQILYRLQLDNQILQA